MLTWVDTTSQEGWQNKIHGPKVKAIIQLKYNWYNETSLLFWCRPKVKWRYRSSWAWLGKLKTNQSTDCQDSEPALNNLAPKETDTRLNVAWASRWRWWRRIYQLKWDVDTILYGIATKRAGTHSVDSKCCQ